MDVDVITDYHAHIYFAEGDNAARDGSIALREHIIDSFDGIEGMTREVAGGPHPTPMVQVNFPIVRFDDVVPWLMLNRGELSVLVHPVTGHDVADHGDHALWLGEPLPINFDAL